MHTVVPRGSRPIPEQDLFIAYVQRFDVVSSSSSRGRPDSVTGMYHLKRSTRSDGSRMGDIIPISQFRAAVELTPRFGREADPRLTQATSMEYSIEFRLNKYFDKEVFYALHDPV